MPIVRAGELGQLSHLPFYNIDRLNRLGHWPTDLLEAVNSGPELLDLAEDLVDRRRGLVSEKLDLRFLLLDGFLQLPEPLTVAIEERSVFILNGVEFLIQSLNHLLQLVLSLL